MVNNALAQELEGYIKAYDDANYPAINESYDVVYCVSENAKAILAALRTSAPAPVGGGDVVGALITEVVSEAEQACRYVAKHNYDRQEEGPYRDGFEVACGVCEKAISRHVSGHKDRILAALQAQPTASTAQPDDVVERVADAIEAASVGYSITLTKLVDGEAEYTATVDGQPPKIFPGHEEASEYVDGFRRTMKARAALAAMQQAPRCVSQNQPDDTQVVLCEAGETQDQQAPVPVNASDMIDQTTTDLHSTMDAVEWAREFLSMDFDPDDIDEGLMIGWFANAIMCGYDHATWKHEKDQQAPVADNVAKAIEPVRHWYESDEHPPRELAAIVVDIVSDLQSDRAECLRMRKSMLSDDQVKHMVNRFLMWRLPDNFNPDGGVSFEPDYNVEYNAKQGLPPQRHEPSGTNLLDYTQAEAMVRHMLDGLTQPQPDAAGAVEQWQPIETAPKDKPILVFYDHNADPYQDPNHPDKLTDYACHAEGGNHLKGRGVTPACWFDGYTESEGWESGIQYWMPGAWAAWFDNDFSEYVLNATHWMPLLAPPAAILAGGHV